MTSPPAIRWGHAITWGAYLACSWTWCIGMFLPILLVRDLGQAGWWAFALPNVVGAAAMGWVLRSSAQASRLRADHLPAARSFSLITVAFHAFFIGWLGGSLLPAEIVPPLLLATGVIAALTILLRERTRWLALATWLFSAAVLLVVLWQRPGAIAGELALPGVLPSTDILWLAPVCAFGFALCPYLDLTFLRVRRLCDGPTGTLAFTIGFGLMFAAMIALTLAYAALVDPETLSRGLLDRPLWALLATIHIALQAAFTLAVHLVELATQEPTDRSRAAPSSPDAARRNPARPTMAFGRSLLLLAALGSAALGVASQQWPTLAGLLAGEVGYRVFMAFYGLVFPTYVWVCVLPRAHPVPPRRALIACAAGIALAAPCFAAGFIWRESVWLAPGLLIAMAARFCVRPAPRATPASDGAAPPSSARAAASRSGS